MKFEKISAIVGDVPFISKKNGRYVYDLIIRERLTNILELGFAHGTATCYMAAALDELGSGSITAVDLIGAKEVFVPSIETQLNSAGLAEYVDIKRMQTGYTWFLHDEIVAKTRDNNCKEIYNLCIIDGPKNWTIDGAAFFMVDKLLMKNGWIIFDDYNWTYSSAKTNIEATDGITHRLLSTAERETPHIREVYEYLVKQHQNYGNFMILDEGDWVLAQKTLSQHKTVSIVNRDTTNDMIVKLCHKLYRLIKPG